MWWFAAAWGDAPVVIVAARDLAVGTVIAEGDLYAILEPDPSWPDTPYTDPARVVGQTVRSRILANEVVTGQRLGVPAPRRDPATGRLGLMVAGTGGPLVDLLRPGDDGCVAVRKAPVLRIGAGTVLVEVEPRALRG